jgi:ABC-type sugar transport system permease subunit
MTKDKLKRLILFGSLMTAIGFILLFFSVNFGTSLAENWLLKQGGADTSTYLIVIEGYIKNFLAAGSILFGSGIATITFAYYKILNIKEYK